MNYMLTGTTAQLLAYGNTYENCEAVNPGYNHVRVAYGVGQATSEHAGFRFIMAAAGAMQGNRLHGCRAYDRQGFYLATDDSPWVLAGGTSATLAEKWTGFTGSYSATFKTTAGNETKNVTLTFGQTTCTWTGGLAGQINDSSSSPWVSRPAVMRYGALSNAGGQTPANVNEVFQTWGALNAGSSGF
jgi:hypothetical protein